MSNKHKHTLERAHTVPMLVRAANCLLDHWCHLRRGILQNENNQIQMFCQKVFRIQIDVDLINRLNHEKKTSYFKNKSHGHAVWCRQRQLL